SLLQAKAWTYKHLHEDHGTDDGCSQRQFANMCLNTRLGIKARNTCQFVPSASPRGIDEMLDAIFCRQISKTCAITDLLFCRKVRRHHAEYAIHILHRRRDKIGIVQ